MTKTVIIVKEKNKNFFYFCLSRGYKANRRKYRNREKKTEKQLYYFDENSSIFY